MGDGGAYLFGVLTSLNVINTSISFPEISPLFFTVLLFYLFFEVFFSFFRKLKANKSPLQPDSTHLHMLIFKFLKNRKKLNNANPKTSLLINFFFFRSAHIYPIYQHGGKPATLPNELSNWRCGRRCTRTLLQFKKVKKIQNK